MTALPQLRVSVVVPTYRRPVLLRRCLMALIAQDLDAREYEIIVIDDGPDAYTHRIIERMRRPERPSLSYFATRGRQGPATARNIGWRAAQAPVIAFTDDDTLAARDWLSQGLDALQPPIIAVAGKVQVPMRSRPTDYDRNKNRREAAEFATANCFVRRAALERVNGFDERFTRAWREDADLHFSLLEDKAPIKRAEHARVLHPIRPARWGECLRQQANGLFEALLYKKHPELYRTKIGARPPWNYYAAVFAAFGVLIGVVFSAELLTTVSALLWLGVWWRLVARRTQGTTTQFRHRFEVALTSVLLPFVAVFWRLRGAWRYRTFLL